MPYTPPIWEVPHDQPVLYAIISGGAYRPVAGGTKNWPSAYNGDIFFSQYYQGYLRRLEGAGYSWSPAAPVSGQPNATDWATGLIAATDFLVGPDGSLWWLGQFDANFSPQTGSLHRIVSTTNTGVGDRAVTAWSLRAAPNPFAATTELSLSAVTAARAELAIHDLAGRRVRTLFTGTIEPGERRFAWNGTDERGTAVGPGVYFARLVREGAPAVTIRILRVR